MAEDVHDWVELTGDRRPAMAHVYRAALEAEGVPVKIKGELLPGFAGELPMNEAQVTVWVPRPQAERAARILRELDTANADVGVQPCPSCGEEVPKNFELCWSCGNDLGA